MLKHSVLMAVTVALLSAPGCGRTAGPEQASSIPAAGASASPYRLTEAPEGAVGVVEAKESSRNNDEVVVTGRVGGESEPFVDGMAAFLIVDPSLSPCPPDEGCPTPWDYCCNSDETAARRAMVKVVDEQGRVVATDARQLLGLDELASVVVRGTAQRDEAGNLTVLASGVYVEP
ncbi:MAG: hypothetical protein KJZ87_17555 [Thermoguttaceae bacterium]|nr:hypothetical protein [Thermoguttaceae bacterium]